MMTRRNPQHPRQPTAIDAGIGRNLRRLRLIAGLSQQQVARAAGVTFQQVQKYESGANRLPVTTLLKLRDLYRVPFEGFFAGVADDTPLPADIPEPHELRLLNRVVALNDQERRRVWRVVEAMLV